MNIQPIGVNQPDFGARCNKATIKTLLDEIEYTRNFWGDFKYKSEQKEFVKIYTLLKRADELPYESLDIQHFRYANKLALMFDGYRICARRVRGSIYGGFKLLKDALVENPFKPLNNDKYVRMPRRIFEQECWKNRNITEEDIYKLAKEEKLTGVDL